ncbi:MAG: hypothetical protein DRJ66_04135 [Thermoprotei archaeon]|nr:MAG: hypothetical protein DRJ66_04135 [Thermoprotei archaeon]
MSAIDIVLKRLREYSIEVLPDITVRFVDRDYEVENVLEKKVFTPGWITVLYGPKGCGKSTLFNALKYAIKDFDINLDIIVVSSEREAWRAEKIYVPKKLKGVLEDIRSLLKFSYNPIKGDIIGFVDITKLIGLLVGHIAHSFKEARDVLVVLDEVKVDSDTRLAEFRGWIESMANDLLVDNTEYRRRGGSIAVIALTSDALVAKIRYVIGSKVEWNLMWNLPRSALENLADQLKLREDKELLWKLTGGNPRALISIKREGLREWIMNEVVETIRLTFDIEARNDPENLWKVFLAISENPDELPELSSVKGLYEDDRWRDKAFKTNIFIYIGGLSTDNTISRLPKEPWIGKYYAFQIPAYMYAVRVMARKRTLKITPYDIINEITNHI